MHRIALLAVASTLALPAAAASDEDLKVLREEVAQMKKSYEQRIEALEQRLAAAESAPVKSQSPQDGAAPARAAGGFNPEVSLILQGQYRRMKDVPERSISGYWPAGGHGHGGDERGLTLDHSELIVSANIDPWYRGMLNVALKDGEAEVEEAWFQTLGLGNGFTLKGGRFLSGIGYLNEQHAHAWDFADAPLMTPDSASTCHRGRAPGWRRPAPQSQGSVSSSPQYRSAPSALAGLLQCRFHVRLTPTERSGARAERTSAVAK